MPHVYKTLASACKGVFAGTERIAWHCRQQVVVMYSLNHIFLLWPSALGILSIANASPVSMHIETLLQVRGHKG